MNKSDINPNETIIYYLLYLNSWVWRITTAQCKSNLSGDVIPGLATLILGTSRHSTTPTMIPGSTCLPQRFIALSFSARVAYLMCAQLPWVGYCLSVNKSIVFCFFVVDLGKKGLYKETNKFKKYHFN